MSNRTNIISYTVGPRGESQPIVEYTDALIPEVVAR